MTAAAATRASGDPFPPQAPIATAPMPANAMGASEICPGVADERDEREHDDAQRESLAELEGPQALEGRRAGEAQGTHRCDRRAASAAIGGAGTSSRDCAWPPARTRSGGRNSSTPNSAMMGIAGRRPVSEIGWIDVRPAIDPSGTSRERYPMP